MARKNIKEILEFNSVYTDIMFVRKNLDNKYQTSVSLFNSFHNFFIIAEKNNYTNDEVTELLQAADANIAYLFCSSMPYSNSYENYCKFYSMMIKKLIPNVNLLYDCLFKQNYYYFIRSLYRDEEFNPEEHLGLIYPFLHEIFILHGEEFFTRCKRGYNLAFLFFILFQEWLTPDMINTCIIMLNKKMQNSRDANIVRRYLNSSHVHKKFNSEQWESIYLLFNLA